MAIERIQNQVDWKGIKREFEKLDVEIGKPQDLELAIRHYSKESEERPLLALVTWVALAVVGIGSAVVAIYVSFVIAPVILIAGFTAIALPIDSILRQERNLREETVKSLEACQRAMATGELSSFAIGHFGKTQFSLEQVLKVHQLFQDDRTIQNLKRGFEENKSEIKKLEFHGRCQ